ncbi:MAG: hypothetical protein JSS20_02095 [Proteobacteria bacterium]|nr:hypothetical protein [Pseudomonadota bacterium]
MPRDIAVVFVHGIYAENSNYSNPMRERLVAALPPRLRPYLNFRPVFWGDIVRPHTQHYLHRAASIADLRINARRRFIVEGLGDAAAYQKTRNRDNSVYYKIQGKITEALGELDSVEDPARPLVFICHSLGCHIASSYAWDVSRLRQLSDTELNEWDDSEVTSFVHALRRWSPLRRLDSFAGLVTMGSNMPLFTFTFGPENVFPITRTKGDGRRPAFPGDRLSESTRRRARWLNFYSPSDLLGYPLRPLNHLYNEEERLEDVVVQSEGRLRSWFMPNVLNAIPAHLGYWTHPVVIRRTADLLASIIEADDGQAAQNGATGPLT